MMITHTPLSLSSNIDLVYIPLGLLRTQLTLFWVVFKTLERELEEGGLSGLTPIEKVDPAAGMAVRAKTRIFYTR